MYGPLVSVDEPDRDLEHPLQRPRQSLEGGPPGQGFGCWRPSASGRLTFFPDGGDRLWASRVQGGYLRAQESAR
jgi:hypothetical protein